MDLPKAARVQAPGFISGVAFFNSWIFNLKSLIFNLKSINRKQLAYKRPDSFVEREKSSESSSRAPGFISGLAFFNSLIYNLKSKI